MAVIKVANRGAVREAAEVLKAGGLVGMPTETVYGLAANALDGMAVARIYEAKGRPAFNPLIVHVPDLAMAAEFVVVDDVARALARRFWPGPLTMILPKVQECGISDLVSAGLDTLAVRVPAHRVALDLLAAAGVPLAAPSANRSGSLSPTTPAHVSDSLGDDVDLILAAGPCAVGLESTVLDLSGDVPVVLRPGGVSAEDLSEVLGEDVVYGHKDIVSQGGKLKSPGMLLKHYAPEIPVRLNAIDLEEGEALLAFGSDRFMGVKGGGGARDLPENMRCNLSEGADLHEAAANLFAMLAALDKSGARGIAVMAVPDTGLGCAINDRLQRASKGSVGDNE